MNPKRLFKTMRRERLDDDRRRTVRNELLSQVTARFGVIPTVFSLWPAVAIVIPLMVIGLGVAWGTAQARQALPGSPWYAVKVNWYEKLREQTLLSKEQRALWHTYLAGKRLEEAAELAARNQLSKQAQLELIRRFETHRQTARVRADMLEKDGDIVGWIMINNELSANTRAYRSIFETLTGQHPSLEPLLHSIENVMKQSPIVQVENVLESPDSVSARTAADAALQAAKKSVQNTRTLLRQQKRDEAQPTPPAIEELRNAEHLLNHGEQLLRSGALKEAYLQFQEAHGEAEEARLLLRLRLP